MGTDVWRKTLEAIPGKTFNRFSTKDSCTGNMTCTGVLINPWPDQEGNKLTFLSEWREFPSAPCLSGGRGETWWQQASWCWNRARLWRASELVSFLAGLRTYQHSGTLRWAASLMFGFSQARGKEASVNWLQKLQDPFQGKLNFILNSGNTPWKCAQEVKNAHIQV